MRALCGAIITAGALLGLGLLSIAMGIRYRDYPYKVEGKAQFVYFRDLDTGLMASFVILVIALLIGLGIAFVGLAYHHHRRHHEFLRLHQPARPGETPPPPAASTGERVSV